MKEILIYDPAMCCSTGVCGPSVDPKLVQISSDIEKLKKEGASVQRYNLSQDLDAFANNETVTSLLAAEGPAVLPITIVNGTVRKAKEYPSLAEFHEWLNEGAALPSSIKKPSFTSIEVQQRKNSCCSGDSCC